MKNWGKARKKQANPYNNIPKPNKPVATVDVFFQDIISTYFSNNHKTNIVPPTPWIKGISNIEPNNIDPNPLRNEIICNK